MGLLSEKTELFLTGKPLDSGDGWAETLKSIPQSISREFKKIAYFLPRLFAILIVTLILTPAAPFIWFVVGAWLLSVQYLDYPADNHNLPFENVKQNLASNRLATLFFGATIAALMMIPLVSIIVIPAAVAGATAFWVKEDGAQPS